MLLPLSLSSLLYLIADLIRADVGNEEPDGKIVDPVVVEELFDTMIQKYRNADPASADEVEARYKKLAGEIGGIFTTTMNRNRAQTYFRGQIASSILEVKRNNPARFSLPPPEHCTAVQRANLIGYPVFYGGDDPRIIMKEIKAKPGEEVFIARWNHPGPITYVNFTFGLGSSPHVQRLTKRMESDIRASIDDDNVNAALALAKGISTAFLDESYVVSSMLAHHHLYNQKIDAIEYASFGGGSGLNYALNPRCADKLSLHRILLVKVCEDDSRYVPLKVGSVSKGEIVWKNVTQEMSPSEYELVSPDELFARKLESSL